jgi:hypothetical protein
MRQMQRFQDAVHDTHSATTAGHQEGPNLRKSK